MWTKENTEGFSDTELAALSAAQAELEQRFAVDASNIADILNNEWLPGMTAADLVTAASKRLG